MFDYFSKPIKNQELIIMLDRWLRIDYSVAALPAKEQSEAKAPLPEAVVPEPAKTLDISAMFDIEHFKSVSLDDPDFKKELISTYLQDTQRRLDILATHINEKNLKGVISEAHTIKGASFSLGILQMGEKAKEMEFAGKDNKPDGLSEMHITLQKHFDRFKQFAEEEILA
jgi:HPt (histidine-containing phosphotransfer) domain-containing protein